MVPTFSAYAGSGFDPHLSITSAGWMDPLQSLPHDPAPICSSLLLPFTMALTDFGTFSAACGVEEHRGVV